MIIVTQNLSKIYRVGRYEVKALREIDFNVDKGEFVAIMGASGSGKSTLMNIIGCLDSSTAGRYYLDGEEVSTIAKNKLALIRNKKIGFVFQTFNLLPNISALKNVELPMIYAGVNSRRRKTVAMEALCKVGLEDRAHHKPNELSGGQKQRVAIARALVNDPAILLADEPTGNLDSQSGEVIMETFKSLHCEGVTIILVTHERGVADCAGRIVRLKDGLIVSDDRVAEPLENGGHFVGGEGAAEPLENGGSFAGGEGVAGTLVNGGHFAGGEGAAEPLENGGRFVGGEGVAGALENDGRFAGGERAAGALVNSGRFAGGELASEPLKNGGHNDCGSQAANPGARGHSNESI